MTTLTIGATLFVVQEAFEALSSLQRENKELTLTLSSLQQEQEAREEDYRTHLQLLRDGGSN